MKIRALIRASAILAAAAALNLLMACNNAPELQPASPSPISQPSVTNTPAQTKPVTEEDIPKVSEGEMAALLWNRLPEQLNNDYQKSQFSSPTKIATYKGNGQWLFQATGSDSKSNALPLKKFEKSPGYWVECSTQQATTCNLSLTANYYEKTDTLEILNIEKSGETTRTDTLSEKRIMGEGVKINWINATTTGKDFRLECSVQNVGIVTLEGVILQTRLYDTKGDLIRSDNITMVPKKIEVGQTGSFSTVVPLTNPLLPTYETPGSTQTFGKYNYRFILSSGKEISFQRPDGSIYYPGTSPTA